MILHEKFPRCITFSPMHFMLYRGKSISFGTVWVLVRDSYVNQFKATSWGCGRRVGSVGEWVEEWVSERMSGKVLLGAEFNSEQCVSQCGVFLLFCRLLAGVNKHRESITVFCVYSISKKTKIFYQTIFSLLSPFKGVNNYRITDNNNKQQKRFQKLEVFTFQFGYGMWQTSQMRFFHKVSIHIEKIFAGEIFSQSSNHFRKKKFVDCLFTTRLKHPSRICLLIVEIKATLCIEQCIFCLPISCLFTGVFRRSMVAMITASAQRTGWFPTTLQQQQKKCEEQDKKKRQGSRAVTTPPQGSSQRGIYGGQKPARPQ